MYSSTLHVLVLVHLQDLRVDIPFERVKGNTNMRQTNSAASDKMKLLLPLLILQLCYAGFHIVSRLALNIGVSKVVYPVYRNIIALILLGPLAYFIEK